jgi:hypothetical protein
MMYISLHNITSITVSEPDLLANTASYLRHITIKSPDGDCLISVFSDNVDSLEIKEVEE